LGLRIQNTTLFRDASRPMLWVGITGIVSALLVTAVALVRGVMVPPEGDLTKAITFDLAVGVYIITIALFVPLAGFTSVGARRWVRIFAALNLYAYAVETTQTLRGIDPRFTRVGSAFDQIVGMTFGLTALALVGCFMVLAIRLWRRPLMGPNGLVLLSLRYAIVVTVMGYVTGFWMGALQGRHVGAEGNILPLHALCFHALQAVPLVAILFQRAKTPDSIARPWIHAAGITWFGICLAVAQQTSVGLPVTSFSPVMFVGYALMAGWILSLGIAMHSRRAHEQG
jgi:hypothetical protein